MTLPRLAGSDTSSLSVNQYRWINFWMAILGQNFIAFPHFFDITRINGKSVVKIFPDNPGKARIFILHFTPLLGIKRRARLIKKAHEAPSRDATSSRVKHSVTQRRFRRLFDMYSFGLSLACFGAVWR